MNNALKLLSPAAQKEVLRAQSEWKRSIEIKCDTKQLDWHFETHEECMAKSYKSRENGLGKLVSTFYPDMHIYSVEHFEEHIIDATKYPERKDDDPLFYHAEITRAYPQIDNPSTDGQKKWNKAMAAVKHRDNIYEDRECDHSYGYKMGMTAKDFISVTLESSFYCNGAAHGDYETYTVNRILSAGRDVTTADILGEAARWQDELAILALDSLKKQERHEDAVNFWPRIAREIADISRWSFWPEGLKINFGRMSGYAGGDYEALIPWDKLKKYMTKDTGHIIEALDANIAEEDIADRFIAEFLWAKYKNDNVAQSKDIKLIDLDKDGRRDIILVWDDMGKVKKDGGISVFIKTPDSYKEISTLPLTPPSKIRWLRMPHTLTYSKTCQSQTTPFVARATERDLNLEIIN